MGADVSPQRLRLSRAKGWRKPEGAVVVSRPSKWGNPWSPWSAVREVDGREQHGWFATGAHVPEAGPVHWGPGAKAAALADCVELFDAHTAVGGAFEFDPADLELLRGKDLLCWCPFELPDGNHHPCHGDTVLRLANPEEEA